MNSVAPMGDLAQHGETLIRNGYYIVPIRRKSKAPGIDDWQTTRSTQSDLSSWLANGHRQSGIGILTRQTPAVDIDVRDQALVAEMVEWPLT